jgi:hypothetical protein
MLDRSSIPWLLPSTADLLLVFECGICIACLLSFHYSTVFPDDTLAIVRIFLSLLDVASVGGSSYN